MAATPCRRSKDTVAAVSHLEQLEGAAAAELARRLREALSCKVCNEWFEDPVCLPCGHALCRVCAQTWFKEQATCPSCRTKVSRRSAATQADNKQHDLIRAVAAARRYVEKRSEASSF
ncbi:hypothetical protein CTAYLR_003905 [Chrysophaeum taylorii]|uniref:RING-type domain-containing protein n=1 Tax=Chrysophaeum taylorii TaxID=2483200 RepID=A0AAD7UAA6_9STRA|nr:hypothetical protein CTAYLR_003905 [Chrysophaeum taylorii]